MKYREIDGLRFCSSYGYYYHIRINILGIVIFHVIVGVDIFL